MDNPIEELANAFTDDELTTMLSDEAEEEYIYDNESW